ncbi:hypothetical protein ABZ858_23460 [Streptomyces sp. NPDC047017]|uniref:hypothetical protein n=1 Tax=Streptomyces sp. NPDC047017 TaxID=3155024 RepID=UPI0033E51FC2
MKNTIPTGLCTAALVTGVALSVLASPAAQAAGSSHASLAGSVSDADRGAAGAAMHNAAAKDRLAAFFVRFERHQDGSRTMAADTPVSAQEAAAEAPRLIGAPTAVYSLSPDFVRGSSTSSPVARLAYLATEAHSSTGQTATVQVERDAHTKRWNMTTILSGADDLTYSREAAGAKVFTEPQIAAWYKIDDDRVLPLNDTARRSVGASGVTVAAYQKLVHDRYADKLPGSAYQRSGKLGGFSPDTTARASTPHTTAAEDTENSPAILITASATALALLAGAGIHLSHRRAVAKG